MNLDPANSEIAPPAAAREPAPTGQALARVDDHFYEELSRINNELANLQRELARTNAEMAATQKKLAISEQRYRNLSACLPIGIFELDAAGRCIYTNSHWQAISGLTAEESLGDGWQRALDPRDAPAFLEERNLARQSGREFSREVRFVNARGDQRWAQVRSRAILAEGGEAAGRVSTVEDITARKRAEDTLRESENKFSKIFHFSPVAMALSTVDDGRYLDANIKFLKMLERPRKDVIGHTATELGFWMNSEQQTAGMAARNVELKIRGRAGQVTDILWSAEKITVGGECCVLGSSLDVTEQKQALEALRESEERFSGAFLQAPIGVALVAPDGHFLRVNRAFCQIMGYTEVELLSRNFQSITHPEDLADALEQVRQVLAGQISTYQIEKRCIHKHGHPVTILLHVSLVRGKQNEPGYFIAQVQDITQQKRAEELQKKLALELHQAQKLEAIGTLAAGIAHEISTPAQYIEHNLRFLQENFPKVGQLLDFCQGLSRDVQADGSAQEYMVKAGGEDVWSAQRSWVEEITEAIADALEGIGRVIIIVRAMKEFSHPGVGATESPVEINLNRAIESTIIVARNEWRYVADVVTEFDPKLPSVPVQPGEFNQVILNVLVNAAQAIEEAIQKDGREKGTITISTHQDGDWVEVRIRDTGPGIPENIRHRIFEPFFTTKPIGKGTGQGLAIARSVIVEKHHGEFNFDTEPGKGSCFKIRLPIKPSRSVGNFTPAPPEKQDPK